ncbi:hypothetical protein ACFYOA_08140 [Streptomyces iakyrus]|uniref:hypothetical protein n=1 Tax=Streptomyces iakyrus TaxID=68219 RepID=UPI0036961F61
MTAVRALTGYRTFYLGKGKLVHTARDSDTVTLCKRSLSGARIAYTPYVSCSQCAKVVNAARAADTEPWAVRYRYEPGGKPEARTFATRKAADGYAQSVIAAGQAQQLDVSMIVENKTTGEVFPRFVQYEGDTMAKDPDELISDVHAKVDEIKALDLGAKGTSDRANALAEDALKIVAKVPTEKRAALRKLVRETRDDVVNHARPDEAGEEKRAAVVRVADDPLSIPGVPELVTKGTKAVRDGVKHGMKVQEVGETLAQIVLAMRVRVPLVIEGKETGLVDLPAYRKTTKNGSALIYAKAREDVPETDTKRNDAHDALQKAMGNKMADVMVDYLRSFDSSPDQETARNAAAELFPPAVKALERAEKRRDEGKDVSDADLSLTEQIYRAYEAVGTPLPRYGRTEVQRFNYRVKQLDTARKELDAARDRLDDDDVSADEKRELEQKETALEDKVRGLVAELPAEWLEKTEPEKTPAQRAQVKVDNAVKLTESVTKALTKLEGAERRAVSGKLVTLGTTLLTNATADAEKLGKRDRTALKTQIEKLVSTLTDEAAKL